MNDNEILAAIEIMRQEICSRLDSIEQRLAASEKTQGAAHALYQCLYALCEDIGATIKALRKAAGLTQRELAEKSGVSYSYLTKLESGESDNPTVAVLKAIEEAAQSADASN